MGSTRINLKYDKSICYYAFIIELKPKFLQQSTDLTVTGKANFRKKKRLLLSQK